MKLLIVDDDFISRSIVHEVASTFGKCDIAVGGKEAIQACKAAWAANAPYDTILLDICMPEMDGLNVLRRIRSIETECSPDQESKSKIIMTTAKKMTECFVAACFEGGASGYIAKPVTHFHLKAQLV